MTEQTVQFGEHAHLAGILTTPPSPRAVCVLVNAGLVPKLGPFRLYVDAARRLAREHIATLRFDLGGIGDSRQELRHLPLRERTHAEITAAIDEVQRRFPDVHDIFIGGLCSGAEDSFRYAERDPRITGALLIDPFSYRTEGHHWRYLAYRMARRALRAANVYEPVESKKESSTKLIQYKYMERAESSRILRTMIERKARVHFIYTGGQQSSFNHPEQLQKMFPDIAFHNRVTVDYFPHLDHTQLLEDDRRQVVTAINAWATSASR
jgi:dienelactone hydrolase